MRGIPAISLPVAVVLAASAAQAGDGVLEINQACAEQTGCFPGDAPGFPVTISEAGSYRLTGNLDVSFASPSPTAIHVVRDLVTIDLNGFSIVGSTTCSDTGGGFSCSPTGSEDGIDAGGFTGGPTLVTVRNGYVQGMPGNGVNLGNECRVEGVDARGNGSDGIAVQTGCKVVGSTADANGDDGIDVDDASVVTGCVAIGNGDDGVEAEGDDIVVANTAVVSNGGSGIERQGRVSEQGNACDDGTCSRHGAKFFYLTKTIRTGATALTACDAGFHMAALWDVFDASGLVYDVARPSAETRSDSGSGPPTVTGWIRTGSDSFQSANIPGTGNCAAWTTSLDSAFGSAATPTSNWDDPVQVVSPWVPISTRCSTGWRVWCVED